MYSYNNNLTIVYFIIVHRVKTLLLTERVFTCTCTLGEGGDCLLTTLLKMGCYFSGLM